MIPPGCILNSPSWAFVSIVAGFALLLNSFSSKFTRTLNGTDVAKNIGNRVKNNVKNCQLNIDKIR